MTVEAWIAEQTPVEEAAALTAQLVAIRSFPGEEGEVQGAVAAWLRAQDILHQMRGIGYLGLSACGSTF